MFNARSPVRLSWHRVSALLWVLALALAGWTLAQLPLRDMTREIGQLAAWHWAVWALLNAVILFLAIWRWQVLGNAVESRLPLQALFRLRQAGSAVSFITPGPHFGGEPLQLFWLHRRFDQPLHRAVAMLGLDRFVETAVNLVVLLGGVLLLLGTALVPVSEWLQAGLVLAGVLVVMFGLMALVLKHPLWLADRLRRMLPGGGGPGQLAELGAGASTLSAGWLRLVESLKAALANQRPRLWRALLLALLGWAALIFELALLLHFLGLDTGLTGLLLILVGMRLAMLLPVPGGIGTVEASVLWTFVILGLPAGGAVALLALIRLRDAVILLVGLACLWSFRRARAAAVA